MEEEYEEESQPFSEEQFQISSKTDTFTMPSAIQAKLDDLSKFLQQNVTEEEALSYLEWTCKKAELKFVTSSVPLKFPLLYGGIYWVYLGSNIGSEEDKHRPAIIIRSEQSSTMTYVVPLTSKRLKDGYWYHIDLDDFDNTALVEQFKPIAKQRIDKPLLLKGKIAKVTSENMAAIHKEITRLFGTPKPPFKGPSNRTI